MSEVLHRMTEPAALASHVPRGHVIVAVHVQLDLRIALKETRPPALILLAAIRVRGAIVRRRVFDGLQDQLGLRFERSCHQIMTLLAMPEFFQRHEADERRAAGLLDPFPLPDEHG